MVTPPCESLVEIIPVWVKLGFRVIVASSGVEFDFSHASNPGCFETSHLGPKILIDFEKISL